MASTVTMAMPAGWRQIEAGPNAERDIATAVDAAYANADRDSSAVAKHWMRQRLRAALQPEGTGGEVVVAIAYPEQPVAGMVLPVSATVLRIPFTANDDEGAMETLALIASSEPNSHVMPTGIGVALRTHTIRDVKGAFELELDEAPISQTERDSIIADVDDMPSLRVRYILPSVNGERWYAIAFSAMLGTNEPELVDTYVELFDAFVQTITVRGEA